MEKIVISEEFNSSLQNLIDVLCKDEYFGFLDSSIRFVLKIYDYIYENLDLPISKPTPVNFSKFGSYFMKYKANQQTTWYMFFDEKNGKYLVNYILTNHSKEFSELLQLLVPFKRQFL